jgi:hypothetical protein
MQLPPIDHLVWGGQNLEQEIERLEAWTGVRALPGGRHRGEGTRNAIIRIGPGIYLELIAPDPEQSAPPHPRWFGLDALTAPRLITWAAKCDSVDQRVAAAQAAGIELGHVRVGQRELDDGQVISWRLTYPDLRLGSGLVPFLIDWGTSRHPSAAAPNGIRLVDFWAEHPEPRTIQSLLRHLGLELRVVRGERPVLAAAFDTPCGRVELR